MNIKIMLILRTYLRSFIKGIFDFTTKLEAVKSIKKIVSS